MSGLFSALQLGREALNAQQLALGVTKNNVANVNTPGYSRQRAQIVEAMPTRIGSLVIGRGATVAEVQVYRDKFIEIRLTQQQQQLGYLAGQSPGLNQLQATFNEVAGNGIQDTLSAFFGTFLQLSSDPPSTPLRQDVLAKANRLASIITSRSSELQGLQQQTDKQVSAYVGEVNRLTQQISDYNEQIVPMEVGGVDSGAIRDQRQVVLNRLAELVDVASYENDNGTIVVMTSSGRSLVTGTRAKSLDTSVDANGFTSVLSDGTDITGELNAGKLGGALHLRDTVFGEVHNRLDALANDLVTRVNAQHKAGFDGNNPSVQGTDLFSLAPAGPGAHAAARLQVAITDPRQVAAGATTASDDNDNAKAMFALSETPAAALDNLSFSDYTSTLSSYVAERTHNNEVDLEAQQFVFTQLQRQRESASGVSLDEEAADTIRFQRAYEASSRFFSVINDLTSELMNLLR